MWIGVAVQLMMLLCRVYRVAHGADIIPYLPPKMLEYADVGPEIFITSTGKVLFNQKVSQQPRSLSPALTAALLDTLASSSVT